MMALVMMLESPGRGRSAAAGSRPHWSWRRMLLSAGFVSVGAGDPEVFDEHCWAQVAEADPAACNPEDPCRSDCWSSVYTHSYCCVVDSPCWWWGREALGDPVRVDVARSGVECRHLCQAEPSCASWSYLIPADGDTHKGGPCVLHGAVDAADVGPGPPAAGVVSGPRICTAPQMRPQSALDDLGSPRGACCVFDAADGDYAAKVASTLRSEGWALLRRALGTEEAARLGAAAQTAAGELLRRDPPRLGNRGPRRYSFGGASSTHHMVHIQAWADLLDHPVLQPPLESAFGGQYVAVGGGGDFVLGGTDTYQSLHVDLGSAPFHELDRPPAVAVNFVVEDLSCAGGPLRVLPGTHRREGPPPTLPEEPQEAKDMVLCPLPAGAALFRDLRAWHGGTPNALDQPRLLPNAEFVSRDWAPRTCGGGGYLDPCSPVLPRSAHAGLSDHGQAVSSGIVDMSGSLVEAEATSTDWLLPDFAQVSRQRGEAY
mmetsp:Transcript_14281/g.40894  ORF Transcript_14281/g.40894 Transcript_14281/m.40894 type:complete len:486 (-) Transcript_14281:17-1474(-)